MIQELADRDVIDERLISRTALKRIGTAEECADAILFLLSDASRYITSTVSLQYTVDINSRFAAASSHSRSKFHIRSSILMGGISKESFRRKYHLSPHHDVRLLLKYPMRRYNPPN